MISVVLPIGPYRSCVKYAEQCIKSIVSQLGELDELVIVDDMVAQTDLFKLYKYANKRARVVTNKWRLGCAASWNVGISEASNNLCLMMGADDWLAPNCLETVRNYFQGSYDRLGYYGLTIQYFDEVTQQFQEQQSIQCNAAVVTKQLWSYTGGFPPEASIGAPDAALISIILGNQGKAGRLYKIAEGTTLYYVRRHSAQDTCAQEKFAGEIISIRNKLTEGWEQPKWGRYE